MTNNMYPALLALHSMIRWLVLVSLSLSLIRSCWGWSNKKRFSLFDDRLRHLTASIAHTQFVIGLCLYIISPIANYFIQHIPDSIHIREIRFFGMEHSLMMFISITLITVGSIKAKRAKTDKAKFKVIAIWFGIALFVIFMSIPWQFSSFTKRPYFRPF